VKWLRRLTTLKELVRHFASRERALLLPLLAVLLLAGVLLVLTTGIAKVAPFVYTLF
jgi:type II secretory pathway component PulM